MLNGTTRVGRCLGWCDRTVLGWYCPDCQKLKRQAEVDVGPMAYRRVVPPRQHFGALLAERRAK